MDRGTLLEIKKMIGILTSKAFEFVVVMIRAQILLLLKKTTFFRVATTLSINS